MTIQQISKIGKSFGFDEKQSVGLTLSMISSFDTFIRDRNEKKINFFKRERLSRKEVKFLSSILNRVLIKDLIKMEQSLLPSEVIKETKDSFPGELKDLIFSFSRIRQTLEKGGEF